MIIIMEAGAKEAEIQAVIGRVEANGYRAILNKGQIHTVIALIGDESKLESTDILEELPGVARVERIQVPFRLASRIVQPEDSVIEVIPGLRIGGREELAIMAGPCSVESEEGIMAVARAVKKSGAKILRGGAYKPRTGPRQFEGLRELGLKLLKAAKEETGLAIVTELMDVRDMEKFEDIADIYQVGARNMQNFSMLDELGKSKKAVLLKRGFAATIDEWLLAAERILDGGNHKVILCERGIRSFDAKYTRNVLDLAAVPVVRKLSHLPIIVDPSHGTGKTAYVPAMAMAAIAAGAHGLMIEVHPDPANALSDGPQSLNFPQYETLMDSLKACKKAIDAINYAEVKV